jgi:hypothetical protein
MMFVCLQQAVSCLTHPNFRSQLGKLEKLESLQKLQSLPLKASGRLRGLRGLDAAFLTML